jgi:hypothetical protein
MALRRGYSSGCYGGLRLLLVCIPIYLQALHQTLPHPEGPHGGVKLFASRRPPGIMESRMVLPKLEATVGFP